MARREKTADSPRGNVRDRLSWFIFGFSVAAITGLAAVVVVVQREEAINVFYTLLPVLASWVGTLLAFYYGRENFESANQQIRRMVQRFSPEQAGAQPVAEHMMEIETMAYVQIPQGGSDADIKMSDLIGKMARNITRLPILGPDKRPKYMIHESRVNKYLAAGGRDSDTLAQFIADQKAKGIEYGLNKGFIIVSENTTLAEATRKLETVPSCQDMFVTKEGREDAPLCGWIPNTRITQLMKV